MYKIKKPIIKNELIKKDINDVSFNTEDKIYDTLFIGDDPNNTINNVEFNGCTFKNTCFDKCNLSFAEIYKSSLNGIDLSNCDINDINIDAKSIKGAIVDLNGAIELSKLLGIKVKF